MATSARQQELQARLDTYEEILSYLRVVKMAPREEKLLLEEVLRSQYRRKSYPHTQSLNFNLSPTEQRWCGDDSQSLPPIDNGKRDRIEIDVTSFEVLKIVMAEVQEMQAEVDALPATEASELQGNVRGFLRYQRIDVTRPQWLEGLE